MDNMVASAASTAQHRASNAKTPQSIPQPFAVEHVCGGVTMTISA
jgi:hypothetical protein